jgi:myo-inositol 2-dehydrogenase / D-chiro-inositol 1-dehydrogenase
MTPPSPVSRRQILRASAAASAAAVMASLGTNFAHAAGSDGLKVGLIGCGGRGTGAARDCAKASPQVQITALGDLFRDRVDGSRKQLEKLGDQYAVADDACFDGFDNYQKVIDSGVDLVLLCEPPGFRPNHFAAAVAANKHVFMEKPVAVDATGIRSIIETSELAAAKNLSVVGGFVFRRDRAHVDAIHQIHDGLYGDIIAGHSYYNGNGLWHHPRQPAWSDAEYQIRNWLYFTWLSGDLIAEQNVHRSDIMNWVMRAHPVSAYGMGGRQSRTDPAYGNVYDHFCIEYEYPGGVKIINQCRQVDNTDTRVTEVFVGTKGLIEPSRGPRVPEATSRPKPDPLGDAYIREHADLIASIVDGRAINEGRQCAESTMTAIMGRMSAYTGKLVTWEQAMNSKEDLFPKELALGPMPTPRVAVPGREPLM